MHSGQRIYAGMIHILPAVLVAVPDFLVGDWYAPFETSGWSGYSYIETYTRLSACTGHGAPHTHI